MPATIIDGAALANRTKADVARRVAELAALGRRVHLTAILVGSTPAGEMYAQRQGESCRAVGIDYELRKLPADSDPKSVAQTIHALNRDPSVTGIMLHLPLPKHLDETEMQYQIDPLKDVEGVNPANIGYVVYRHTLIAPCTALSAVELIKSTGVPIRGADACVVGASAIAGKPAALLLTEEMATVTLCHIATRDLAAHTRRADIVVVAVGKPNLIGAEHVRDGAVVIDIGINRVTLPDGTKKTVGDVDFEAVKEKAGHLTPVPGGVGPMTVAMLLQNTLRSAELVSGVDLDDDAVPASTQDCPALPLTYMRHSDLREFLRTTLRRDQAMPIAGVYAKVLEKFGPGGCKPEQLCPQYKTTHPEFRHIVRLALWDGQRAGEFTRAGRGNWKHA
ncbi:MAG: bifunctional 5,10-methylenetetrahydrofolate dehydrogenase/5,10-methenyltetrahydrofolate cyclohydrolase [Tepidisphaeraceae bacterium]